MKLRLKPTMSKQATIGCPTEPQLLGEAAGFSASRGAILRALGQGPLEIRHLPACWPLTRPHLGTFVEQLAKQGLIAYAGARHGSGRRIRLTRAGAALAGPPPRDRQPAIPAEVLAPHFERENQIALPPLGLLAALAHGEAIPDEVKARALAMTDSLRAELPGMLEEHVRIAAAAQKLERVAREHGDADVESLARQLQVHARMEEEVSYPAAVLVGTLLRHR
jgi:hypothetical protein